MRRETWRGEPANPNDTFDPNAVNLENMWYAYNRGGHVKRIVRNYPAGGRRRGPGGQ